MKRIYTYGHQQVQRNLTIGDIVENSKYPNSDYTISMDDGELDKLINELEKE